MASRDMERFRPPAVDRPDGPDVVDSELSARRKAPGLTVQLSTVIDSLGAFVKVVDAFAAASVYLWGLKYSHNGILFRFTQSRKRLGT